MVRCDARRVRGGVARSGGVEKPCAALRVALRADDALAERDV
jgi:hypothetical protein